MGLFGKDVFDQNTGHKIGTHSRITGNTNASTRPWFSDRNLVDKNGNHVTIQSSIIKESAGAIIGITAGIIGIIGSIINRDD